MEDRSSIFFMHIPKTGGTSINRLMAEKELEPRYIGNTERFSHDIEVFEGIKDRFEYFSGHLTLSRIFEIFRDKRPLVFTMIREPIEQLASHLCWVDHYNDEEFNKDYFSLDSTTKRTVDDLRCVDFSDPGSLDYYLTHLSPQATSYFDNCQSRYLLSRRHYGIELATQLTLNMTPLLLEAMSDLLFIGHMTSFEKSIECIARILCLNSPILYHENKSRNGRKIDLENEMTVGVLRKRCLLDEWFSREVLFRLSRLGL